MKNRSSIAVSGMGCLCAAGRTPGACLDTMLRGQRQPEPPKRFHVDHPLSYPVFEIPDFQSPPDLLRTSALGLAATYDALDDAGLARNTISGLRIGVCVGTTVGCTLNDEGFCRDMRAGGTPDLDPIQRILHSNPAAVLARTFNLKGPFQTIVNACASGTDAIGIGALWIREGLCDLVLAGGADELSRITTNGFISMKIADDSPCRPFDRDRKGLNLGEGAAILVLENEVSLRRRRGRARAWLLGYGNTCDAHHQTAPHPEGLGLRRALREALSEAEVGKDSIAFINAHGTGTQDNDRVEGRVLSDEFPGVPYLSTKGYTGHTLGAAGAIEAVFTVMSLERDLIPASGGFQIPDPELGGMPVSECKTVKGDYAISQSLAFGGGNAAVVFGKPGVGR